MMFPSESVLRRRTLNKVCKLRDSELHLAYAPLIPMFVGQFLKVHLQSVVYRQDKTSKRANPVRSGLYWLKKKTINKAENLG